ncbi:hypothetical protein CEXT_585471 [Caerostris extrusa]|uniref:Uncharacterized protein n=1 Tax=Caerostris extrusa TaxID=172846 RepID=A0AAV4PJT2_CAEEX|nr:hypothetical protein CEXT_585471 [Caerostris extrusa]
MLWCRVIPLALHKRTVSEVDRPTPRITYAAMEIDVDPSHTHLRKHGRCKTRDSRRHTDAILQKQLAGSLPFCYTPEMFCKTQSTAEIFQLERS